MSKPITTRIRYATIAALAFVASLAGAAYADKGTHQTATQTVADTSSPTLTVEEIVVRLRAAGYSDFHEIEREKGRYEVEGLDAEGGRVELYVDAATGEIVKEERGD